MAPRQNTYGFHLFTGRSLNRLGPYSISRYNACQGSQYNKQQSSDIDGMTNCLDSEMMLTVPKADIFPTGNLMTDSMEPS